MPLSLLLFICRYYSFCQNKEEKKIILIILKKFKLQIIRKINLFLDNLTKYEILIILKEFNEIFLYLEFNYNNKEKLIDDSKILKTNKTFENNFFVSLSQNPLWCKQEEFYKDAAQSAWTNATRSSNTTVNTVTNTNATTRVVSNKISLVRAVVPFHISSNQFIAQFYKSAILNGVDAWKKEQSSAVGINSPRICILEVGSGHGRCAAALASRLKEQYLNFLVVATDMHDEALLEVSKFPWIRYDIIT